MRTCTIMNYTTGKTARYIVLRGRMLRNGAFDSRTATVVGAYVIDTEADYRAMTAAHATPEAPAVYWQA